MFALTISDYFAMYIADRQRESEKIQRKHPDVVPVILEFEEELESVDEVKRKYLAPKTLKTPEFELLLRKRYASLTNVYFSVDNKPFGSPETTMESLYNSHKDGDGFLYLLVNKKPSFSFESIYSLSADKVRKATLKARRESGELPVEVDATPSGSAEPTPAVEEDTAEIDKAFETLDVGMLSKAIGATQWLMGNTVGWLVPSFGSPEQFEEARREREVHVLDFEAIRTNWYGRTQKRVYRFTCDNFYRLDSSKKIVKCTFHYDNIKELKVTDGRYLVIKFHDKSQYGHETLETPFVDVVKEIITKRIHPSKEFRHVFMNDRNVEPISAASHPDEFGSQYKLFLELGLIPERNGEVVERAEEDVDDRKEDNQSPST